jgi:uncharacterized protein
MSAEFYVGHELHTPSFRIELDGREAGPAVLRDVLEVSFTDDLEAVNGFEFTLFDWDPVALNPRYSSPWDENGTPVPLYDGGPPLPAFDPGVKVSLYLGYVDDGELPLIMDGEIVSLTPSFPASGTPTCRVRAVDAFLRELQKTPVEGNYSGTAKTIVDQLCREHGVQVDWAPVEEEGAEQERCEVEGMLFDEISNRAKEFGLVLTTVPPALPGGTPSLFLADPAAAAEEAVATLHWGRSLLSFTPVLSASAQVAEVVVRAADPKAAEANRAIEVVRTWADVGLKADALGPAGTTDLDTAVQGSRDILKPDEVATVEDATKAADKRLRELARQLITGSGESIGLPLLRAGAAVELEGLGLRFNGTYRITKATHSIGSGGYKTSFSASKEVLEQ